MGLFLLFSQVPFISVLFMNPYMREAYITGRNAIEARKELEVQTAQISASQPTLQEQEAKKTPVTSKPNPTQEQKKKKKSK